MATYYVATTGNDTTGNGSSGTPWRTINKAYLAFTAGDTNAVLNIADGTYQETSGSGWIQFGRTDITVTIQGQAGASSNVTIQGVSSAQEVVYQGTNHTFKYVKFVARDLNTTRVVRINANGLVTFFGCTFTIVPSASQSNAGFGVGTSSTAAVSGITFDGCTFTQASSILNNGYGINIFGQTISNTYDQITVKNCTGYVGKSCCSLQTATNIQVYNNKFVGDTYGFNLGIDGPQSGAGVFPSSGTIYGNVFQATVGHGVLLGAGITSATFQGNVVIGGSDGAAGQGLVIKEGSNISAIGNLVLGGYINVLYVKAAQSPIVLRNVAIGLYVNSTIVLRIDKNFDAGGANFSNVTCKYNYICAPMGTAIGIGTGENGSTSVVDSNVYDVRGTAAWGTVRSTTLAGFSSLAAAWAGYATAGNDSNSLPGSSANAQVYRHSATAGAVPTPSGPFLYKVVFDRVGNVWNGTSFAPMVAASWPQYASYLVEATPSGYLFTTPVPLNLPAGDYRVTVFSQVGPSPALGDTMLTTQDLTWDGAQPVRFGSVYSRLGIPSGGSLAADVASVKGDTTTTTSIVPAIKAKTDNLPASPAAVGSAMSLATGTIGSSTFADGTTLPAVASAMSLATGVINSSTFAVGTTLPTVASTMSLGTGAISSSTFADGTTLPTVASVASAVTLPDTPPSGYGGSTVIHSGTATGGTSQSITLDSGASDADGTYRFNTIWLTGGTGLGQSAVISGYNGTTKVATITSTWATTPDGTTQFAIGPLGAVVQGQLAPGPRTVTQDYLGADSLTVINQVNGLPIQGATVTAYLESAYESMGNGATVIAQTTTDASGHWTLTLDPADYTVVFAFGADEMNTVTFVVN